MKVTRTISLSAKMPNKNTWISFDETEDMELNPVPKWLKEVVDKHNMEQHIYSQHPDWVEAWEWLKKFSPDGGKLAEDYTIDSNLQNNG